MALCATGLLVALVMAGDTEGELQSCFIFTAGMFALCIATMAFNLICRRDNARLEATYRRLKMIR